MNDNTLKGQWNTIKRKLKEFWRDLTNDEVNNIKDDHFLKKTTQIVLPLLLNYTLLYAADENLKNDTMGTPTESHAARAHRESKEVLTNSGETPLISDKNFNEQRCKKINDEMKCIDKNAARTTTEPVKNDKTKRR